MSVLENQSWKRHRITLLEEVNEDIQVLSLLEECFLLRWPTESSISHCQGVFIEMNFIIISFGPIQLLCVGLYHVSIGDWNAIDFSL